MADIYHKLFHQMGLEEATTISSIIYLPSGLGAVKSAIRGLAKMKRDWNIEILEADKGRNVIFEDELNIFVPFQCWNDFSSMFSERLEDGKICLQKYLKEVMADEVKQLQRELRPAITSMMTEEEFRVLDRIVNQWRARFGIKEYRTRNVLVTFEDRERDIQKVVANLVKAYGEDRGNLELLLQAIYEDKPLNTFEVFKDYDFLYGTSIYSVYHHVPLTYEAVIDPAHQMSQTILVGDSDVAEALQDTPDVKVIRDTIYPVGGSFSPKFFKTLRNEILELVDDEIV